MPDNFSFVIPGKLAGCARPGRAFGNLRSDLSGLARRGIGALVTLTPEALDPVVLRESGLESLHLPIQDFQAPTPGQIREFVAFVDSRLERGLAVAVHCGAGFGRTGTMLACYLVSRGATPEEAIRTVRRERPGSVETAEQERTVGSFSRPAGREGAGGEGQGTPPP
ncbi:MAG: dual specificity protein phosphatase family protein [Planctomycetota bacterium]|jgi:atypical dual specificity phosphatase|nr:dual specificity protein phosphatase family protein [Planctomycetota bacterium]